MTASFNDNSFDTFLLLPGLGPRFLPGVFDAGTGDWNEPKAASTSWSLAVMWVRSDSSCWRSLMNCLMAVDVIGIGVAEASNLAIEDWLSPDREHRLEWPFEIKGEDQKVQGREVRENTRGRKADSPWKSDFGSFEGPDRASFQYHACKMPSAMSQKEGSSRGKDALDRSASNLNSTPIGSSSLGMGVSLR